MSKISIVGHDYSCTIKWDLCVLCQKGTSKDCMRCPATQSNRSNIIVGYESLEKNINELKSLNQLPFALKFDLLKYDNMSMAETLLKNEAKWHLQCAYKVNNKQVLRAKKRSAKEMEDNSNNKDDGVNGLNECSWSQIEPNATSTPLKNINQINLRCNVINCFICDKGPNETEDLHILSSKYLENKIKMYVKQIDNAKLTAQLQNLDDLVSTNKAKYHRSCITNLYNSCRPFNNENKNSPLDNTVEGICFSQLISHIEEIRNTTTDAIFKMPALAKFYIERLEELSKIHNSSKIDWKVHTSKLRAKILLHFDDLVEELVGREYVLISKNSVSHCIQTLCNDTYDEALDASRVAKTIR